MKGCHLEDGTLFLSFREKTMLDHLAPVVILVEPQQPGNIGAVCRAMANFGLDQLRLVNPCDPFHPEAIKFSVSARPLLGQAELFTDLASALEDVHYSVALTRRGGRLRGELETIEEVFSHGVKLPSGSRLALVFGREDCGLSTQEVAMCSHAATIATSGKTASLNLAQAVVVTLYELSRQRTVEDMTEKDLPTQSQIEALFGQMETLVERIGYTNPSRPEVVPTVLRRLINQAQPDVRELNILRGLINQLEQSVHDWPGKRRG
jgi:tRNA/rRNA methyltransferase